MYMKHIFKFVFILLILLITAVTNNFAADSVYIKLKIKNNAIPSQSLDKLAFGIHSLATDSLDAMLGEKEYPPIPLPSGIFMAYMISYDARQNQTVWTYLDIRPFAKDSDHFYREYNMRLFFGLGSAVTVSWDNLSNYIDSAKVQDPFGYLVNIDMKKANEFTTNDILLDEFIFKIWFNTTGTSIKDDKNTISSIIFPNPATDFINIDKKIQIKSFVLFNLIGNELLNLNSTYTSNTISLPNLETGIYFAKISDFDGNNYFEKIIIR